MRSRLILLSVIFLALFATACSTTPKTQEETTVISGKTQIIPQHFHHIPADTPYFVGGFEPVDLSIYAPAMSKSVQYILDIYRQDEPSVHSAFPMPLLALLEELEGKSTEADFNALGLTLKPHISIYGIGPFPVLRMEIHDSESFIAVLDRIEEKAGATVVKKQIDTVTYREYRDRDMIFPIAVSDNYVVAGLTHFDALDATIPHIVGQHLPETSLADKPEYLAQIIEKNDFLSSAFGYLSFERLWDLYARNYADGSLADQIMTSIISQPPEISPACETEYTAMIGKMPRVVFGNHELSRNIQKGSIVLEMDGELSNKLMTLRSPMPAYDVVNGKPHLLSIGLGLNINNFLTLASEYAQAIQETPYECEDFYAINEHVVQEQFYSSQLPPFIRDLQGLMIFSQLINSTITATALVQSADALGLYGMLSNFVPALQSVNVQPGQGPVQIESLAGMLPFISSVYVGLTQNILGVALGESTDILSQSIESTKQDVQTPLLRISYDWKALSTWLEQTTNGMHPIPSMGMDIWGVDTGVMELDIVSDGIILRVTSTSSFDSDKSEDTTVVSN